MDREQLIAHLDRWHAPIDDPWEELLDNRLYQIHKDDHETDEGIIEDHYHTPLGVTRHDFSNQPQL